MPQFELVNFVPQMAWLVLAFAILYFGIVRATLPRLGKTIDARENKVMGDLGAAQSAKDSADRMQADYDAGIAAAQDAARANLAKARTAANKAQEARLADAAKAIVAKVDAAEAALGKARDKAMAEIQTVAADAAAEIVEKLTGARPAADDSAAAVRAALG